MGKDTETGWEIGDPEMQRHRGMSVDREEQVDRHRERDSNGNGVEGRGLGGQAGEERRGPGLGLEVPGDPKCGQLVNPLSWHSREVIRPQ